MRKDESMIKHISIREATPRDIPAVVDFYMRLDNPGQREWIEIMMDGRHPYVDASNLLLAEDEETNRIAACVIYMPWTYSYGGILCITSRAAICATCLRYCSRRRRATCSP